MVKDVKNGECFRADHLIKNSAEKVMADKSTSAETRKALTDVLARLDGFDDKDMHNVSFCVCICIFLSKIFVLGDYKVQL